MLMKMTKPEGNSVSPAVLRVSNTKTYTSYSNAIIALKLFLVRKNNLQLCCKVMNLSSARAPCHIYVCGCLKLTTLVIW